MAHGNDWAHGFMLGMGMRHDGWAELVNDEEHGGCLIPTMMLYHEHDKDPEMRPQPSSPEQQEDVIVHMAAGFWGRNTRSAVVERLSTKKKASSMCRDRWLPTVEAIYKNMPASCDNRRKEINRHPVAFDGGVIFSQARVQRFNEGNAVDRYRDR